MFSSNRKSKIEEANFQYKEGGLSQLNPIWLDVQVNKTFDTSEDRLTESRRVDVIWYRKDMWEGRQMSKFNGFYGKSKQPSNTMKTIDIIYSK